MYCFLTERIGGNTTKHCKAKLTVDLPGKSGLVNHPGEMLENENAGMKFKKIQMRKIFQNVFDVVSHWQKLVVIPN